MAEKREAATRQAAGIKEKGNVKKGKPKVDKDDDDDDDESSSSASDDTEPRSFEAMAKALGSRWRHLDPEKKQRFIDMASKDQQRYRREMEIYKEKLVAETVLGAAYLKKQRLQREQAAQGEDNGSAPQGGEDENMQGETTNAQVPNQIDIPAASVFASASSSGGTASSATAAAPSSSDIAQQILFLQGQQQQQILLSQLGQSPPYLVTSHDLWLQQQQLHAQQQHLQREQIILNAAVATAQRSSSQSQFQVQMGNNNSLDGATAALFLNPAPPPPQQLSVELQQTLWRLQQQQQQAQESNQLHSLLSQFQQHQQQQVGLSQNLAVRPFHTAPRIMGHSLPQFDLVHQQNLLNNYNLGGQHTHPNASASLSPIQQPAGGSLGAPALLASFPSQSDNSTTTPSSASTNVATTAAAAVSGSGLTSEQLDILRAYQQQRQDPSTPCEPPPERYE
jgi:LysM repeat protein